MRFCWLFCVLVVASTGVLGADWRSGEDVKRLERAAGLVYVERTVVRVADGRSISAHLAFFKSRDFRLKVVDLGADINSGAGRFADAFRSAGCLAGVNGGFFHPDGRPLGLVIADERRINQFETSKLLTGVLYGDDRGIHLMRRGRFAEHPGIDALLQSGPYLVEGGRAVRGLSATARDRRTFVATDWRGHWVLGITRTSMSLAELAQCLVAPGVLTPWTSTRALNLDGGSSTGFFLAGGADAPAVVLSPRKPVRNLLCIRPR